MALDRLTNAFYRDDATRGVLAILADQPLEQKRAEVYPAIVPFVATYLCETPPKEPRSLDAALAFLRGELVHAPELAGQLYAAIGDRPVRHGRAALFELVATARDRRGLPLLRRGAGIDGWVDAVLALDARELTAEIAAALVAGPTTELATLAGLFGMRAPLNDGLAKARGPCAIGIAFLDGADKTFFDTLGSGPDARTARRIKTLLSARGPKQRMTALEELLGEVAESEAIGLEHVMAFTLALADKRADIVQRAAAVLAAYRRTRRHRVRTGFTSLFLALAPAAIERGVTAATLEAFAQIHAAIPGAPPLHEGAAVPIPATREDAAKARAQEIVETMQAITTGTTGQRDEGLEAHIAAAPDDRSGYLVYADWLQTRGDPRGAWITLHTATGLGAPEALAAFLAQHRDALLGPFAAYAPKVEWFMGFVKSAQIAGPNAAAIARALLESPCGAFVRELAFLECDEDAVVEVMLELRPQTLVRLALGTRDEPTPALAKAMPNLVRDPRTRWEAALARLAEHRKVKVEVPAELPALVPVAKGISYDQATVLRGLKYEVLQQKPLGLCAAIRSAFLPDSVDRFARALADTWLQFQDDRLRWTYVAAGALGGDATARLMGESIGTRLVGRERIGWTLRLLEEIGTETAIEELARLAFDRSVHVRERSRARSALDLLAVTRETELDAMIARLAPSPDERGLQIQRHWLESLMIDGRSLDGEVFVAMLRDPVRRAAARTLLWAERGPEGIAGLFRVDAAGTPVKRDGSPHEIRLRVVLPHPAELTEQELAGAGRAFAGVEQAIQQLVRPVLGMSIDDAHTRELIGFAKRRVGFAPISQTLFARGWRVAESDHFDDDGEERWAGTRAFARRFERDGIEVLATLNHTRGSIATVTVERDGPRTFDELHVVTISELLLDLELAHGRNFDAPPPPAPASRGAQPVVERAKSGRSKCVVCGEPIAKDSLRVGIERMIETPAFRGRATVWLHPACRDGAPELEGVALALD